MLKRPVLTAALMVLALSAGVGAALADNESKETIVTPVENVTIEARCPQLPAGVAPVTLQGTLRTTTEIEPADDDAHGHENAGALEVSVRATATGTATDALGNHYTFFYRNTVSGEAPGTGILRDSFRLEGHGPAAGLFASFKAKLTFGNVVGFDVLGAITDFVVISEVGNPIDFTTFTPICDPL